MEFVCVAFEKFGLAGDIRFNQPDQHAGVGILLVATVLKDYNLPLVKPNCFQVDSVILEHRGDNVFVQSHHVRAMQTSALCA